MSGRACQTSLRRKPRQRRQGLYLANNYLKSVPNGLENNLARTSTGYDSMLVARSSRSSWPHMVEQWNVLCGPCDYLGRGCRYNDKLGQTWSIRSCSHRRHECVCRSTCVTLRNSSGKYKIHLVFVAL